LGKNVGNYTSLTRHSQRVQGEIEAALVNSNLPNITYNIVLNLKLMDSGQQQVQ
jgi:hypothetical protein